MPPTRRRFFTAGAAGAASLMLPFLVQADDAPTVTNPRATDGDSRHEPSWDERLTLTVGHSTPSSGVNTKHADLLGQDDRVLQAAIDFVAAKGGGTVKILSGVYRLRAAVSIPSGIRVIGSGEESIITRIASNVIPLAADSDWYDQEVTLAPGADFRVGDSVVFRAKNPHDQGATVIKRTIVARSGNRLKLNDGLRENLWLSGEPTCASLFPLFTSENSADVIIENITLDGNREHTDHFDGNYGGCIFLQDCNRFTFRNVETRNYNGDGISFQICHDIVVDRCYSHDNADLGVHPGSGSQRPLIRDCRLERNGLGLFWCWGVKFGLAEGNRIIDNRDYGVSIGHNDTDNVMIRNEIIGSGKVGILFRDESRGSDFWANRNVIEDNLIENSGDAAGIAIDVQGATKDVRIERNRIVETRGAAKRIGIRISGQASRIHLKDNDIRGFASEVLDQRES